MHHKAISDESFLIASYEIFKVFCNVKVNIP